MPAPNTALVFALGIAFASAGNGQALSLDPPSQIGAEIKRTDAAWSAWRAASNPKLEQTILTNPHAIADIARDEEGALQYLDARRRLFHKMAEAFASQIAALRGSNPAWNTAAIDRAEKQKLAELLAAEERLLAVPKGGGGDPAREMLLREQRERDLAAVADLKRTIQHRIESLEAMAGEERTSSQQLDALIGNLEQVRRHFQDLAGSTEAEKSDWQDYFAGLRQIVMRDGMPQQEKPPKSKADTSPAAKPRRER